VQAYIYRQLKKYERIQFVHAWNDALVCGVDDVVERRGMVGGFDVGVVSDCFYQTSTIHATPPEPSSYESAIR